MKAKLPSTPVFNGKNLSTDKELIRTYNLIACKKDTLSEVIVARFWKGRSSSASVIYASILVDAQEYRISGHGMAGGGNYDKASAALEKAIASAGIELDEQVSRGGGARIREALVAIAKALGFKKMLIVEN